jgi:hypothetical protein
MTPLCIFDYESIPKIKFDPVTAPGMALCVNRGTKCKNLFRLAKRKNRISPSNGLIKRFFCKTTIFMHTVTNYEKLHRRQKILILVYL